MSQFAQSIRRLYQAGRISLDKVKSLLAEGKITTAEYDWIADQDFKELHRRGYEFPGVSNEYWEQIQ